MIAGRPGLGAQPRVDIATTLDEDAKVIFGSGGDTPWLPTVLPRGADGPDGVATPLRSAEAPDHAGRSVHRVHSRTDEIVARLRRR